MKTYIITNSPFPYGMAPVKRKICFAKALIEKGVECKVLIFSRTEAKGKPTQNTQGKGVFEGIPFEYVGGKTTRCSNALLAKIETFCLINLLYIKLLFILKKGDVVYVYTHDKFAKKMNNVVKIAHLKGTKVARELCEVPGKGIENSEGDETKQYILQKCLPNYDGIVAISDALVDLAHKYARPSTPILKIPIVVEYDKYYLEDKSSEAQIPYIFHSGSLSEQKDGILGMIEAFGKACQQLDKPIQFICTGNKEKSPQAKEIDALITKYNLEGKLIFTGFISDEMLKDYLQKASMVIINKATNQQNTYCFSTKLGEYMAAGKAIIITKVGEAMNWLTDGRDAIIISPSKNDELVETIIHLLKDIVLRKHLGENASETCKNSFDYQVFGKPLKEYFEQL